MSKPTWMEVRKRSEVDRGNGVVEYCADCYFLFNDIDFGCRTHTLPSEVDGFVAAIEVGLKALTLSSNPLFELVNRKGR